MSYPEMMIKPMREDVTRLGVTELRTVEDVDQALGNMQGTAMVFVNSVCGCAAGGARPALMMALAGEGKSLDHLYTVFAGQDLEATARARELFGDVPPSSPSVALLKDGELVHFVPRHMIEGRDARSIAEDLTAAFAEYC